MASFETPAPISVTIEVGIAEVRIVAGTRSDTEVTVKPSNLKRNADKETAEQITVGYASGNLLVKGPKGWRVPAFFKISGSVDITIEVPECSDVTIAAEVGSVFAEGQLGLCKVSMGMGSIYAEQVKAAHIKTGHGDVAVQSVQRDSEISTGSGAISVGQAEGRLVATSGNGKITVGSIQGEAQVKTGNGPIEIMSVEDRMTARSGNGRIVVRSVKRGQVMMQTGNGSLDIGIAENTRAWLDVHTQYGSIRNAIPPKEGPGEGFDTAEIRARTSHGDIAIARAV